MMHQLIKWKFLKETNGLKANAKAAVMSTINSLITIQATFLQQQPDLLLISP